MRSISLLRFWNRLVLVVLTRDVLADLEEVLDVLLALIIVCVLEMAGDLFGEGILVHLCSCIADDVCGLGEQAEAEEVGGGGRSDVDGSRAIMITWP